MSPEDRKKYIILGVLVLAAVGVVAYQLFSGPDVPAPPPRPAQQANGAPSAAAAPTGSAFVQADIDVDALIDSIQEVDFNYDTEAVTRHPMTPLVGVARLRDADGPAPIGGFESPALAIARSMVITGIVYDADEPMAVLENRSDQEIDVVTVGHSFPVGIMVESIEESRVVLRVGDMRIPKMLEEQ